MSDGVITRPATQFNGPTHRYHDEEGQRLWGISSVAKIGEAEDSFGVGSAWGFRVGYEGALELIKATAEQVSPGLYLVNLPDDPADLRRDLNSRGLTPWGTRDRAADRGNWGHDLLEALATDGTVPTADLLSSVNEEYQGHGRGILQWFINYRPSFVATEVQVTSVVHGFAGRYDIRCKIRATLLLRLAREQDLQGPVRERIEQLAILDAVALCLVDLKTSKRIYPTSHYVQLEGYELASVEMGFPATDVRCVLNTRPDGTYHLGLGYSTPQHFLNFLGAYRAIKGLKELDPEERKRKATEEAILALLPAVSRDIAGKDGVPDTAQAVGKVLGGLRKRGLVGQDDQKVWVRILT